MSEHRLKLGTHTAAEINADAASVIKNWTTTLTTGGWIVAEGLSQDSARNIVFKYVEREIALDGHIGTFGGANTGIRIARMNDAMWAHLITVLPDESTDVTFKTRDRQKSGGAGWEVYNCICHRPAYNELRTIDGIWYVDTPLRFINMTIAAAGE